MLEVVGGVRVKGVRGARVEVGRVEVKVVGTLLGVVVVDRALVVV